MITKAVNENLKEVLQEEEIKNIIKSKIRNVVETFDESVVKETLESNIKRSNIFQKPIEYLTNFLNK